MIIKVQLNVLKIVIGDFRSSKYIFNSGYDDDEYCNEIEKKRIVFLVITFFHLMTVMILLSI